MVDAPQQRAFVVRPCSPERPEHDVRRGYDRVAALGFALVGAGDACPGPLPFLAGPDEDRAAALAEAFGAARTGDVVWAMRGGTGSIGTLARWAAPGANPEVPLLGLSDVTALLVARFRRGGRAVHAPGVGQLGAVDAPSLAAVAALLAGQPPGMRAPSAQTLVAGRARGRLIGGNLSVLAALAGSAELDWGPGPWLLLLEDTGEPSFRLHRLLWQLRAAGVFAPRGASPGVVGLALGTFDSAPAADTLACLRHHAEAIGLPSCAHLPFGHTAASAPFELGAWATLDADAGVLTVEANA